MIRPDFAAFQSGGHARHGRSVPELRAAASDEAPAAVETEPQPRPRPRLGVRLPHGGAGRAHVGGRVGAGAPARGARVREVTLARIMTYYGRAYVYDQVNSIELSV